MMILKIMYDEDDDIYDDDDDRGVDCMQINEKNDVYKNFDDSDDD